MSVPDSDRLVLILEVLETPVSILLGKAVVETEVDSLKAISEKWGGDQLAAGTKGNHEEKESLLVAYLIVCGHCNDFCGSNRHK